MKVEFGEDMPGKMPFKDSGYSCEKEKMYQLSIDTRITSREFRVLIAYLMLQQYYEVKKVDENYLAEMLGFSKNSIKKYEKKLVELNLLEIQE